MQVEIKTTWRPCPWVVDTDTKQLALAKPLARRGHHVVPGSRESRISAKEVAPNTNRVIQRNTLWSRIWKARLDKAIAALRVHFTLCTTNMILDEIQKTEPEVTDVGQVHHAMLRCTNYECRRRTEEDIAYFRDIVPTSRQTVWVIGKK